MNPHPQTKLSIIVRIHNTDLVVESILEENKYRDYIVSINNKDNMTELPELDMVDSDIILGMD